MKFLIDAQLPRRLAQALQVAGHDTLHTLDLPQGNRTTDEEIVSVARNEDRVVVTKDSDFVTTFQLNQNPRKLLLLSTGNISNEALLQLILKNLGHLESVFAQYDFVELNAATLTIHA